MHYGDLNTRHLKTRNIYMQDFYKSGFQMRIQFALKPFFAQYSHDIWIPALYDAQKLDF